MGAPPTRRRDNTSLSLALASDARTGQGLYGVVRLGRRTKDLTRLLPSGAVVVLDHADLDGVAARGLIACRPVAVVNCAPFVSGHYPNRGPGLLLEAGIPLFETTDDLFALLENGDDITLQNDNLFRRGEPAPIAALTPLTSPDLAARLAHARAHLDDALLGFAENTLRYLGKDHERTLLLDPVAVPDVRTPIAGRPVLVVVRGEGYEDDLKRLMAYVREQRPVVLAVDGAADTLLAAGIRPHIILGDMDSVGDAALRCGAELIVHAYARPDKEAYAPGLARIEALGLPAQVFAVAGTSEDAALLLAYEKSADLIVAVGTHTNLEDFLDKGRGGMASTFLVRLKVGSRLVDARGVSRLYAARSGVGKLLFFLGLSALFPVAVLLAGTPQGQVACRSVVVWLHLWLHR